MPIPYLGEIPNFFEFIKSKKLAGKASWYNQLGNHPNRLVSISMTGTTSFERDGRVTRTPTTALTATRRLIEVDYSILPTWNRIIRPKTPFLDAQLGFGTGEFGLFSSASSPWKAGQISGATPASVIVGADTTYNYSRAVDTDPWTEDDYVETLISMQWSPKLALNSLNHFGGHPVSGGKGPDDEDNSISINSLPSTSLIDYFENIVIYRLPWDQAWAPEADLLSDAFDAYLAAEIAANPDTTADYSGTCSAEVVFTF